MLVVIAAGFVFLPHRTFPRVPLVITYCKVRWQMYREEKAAERERLDRLTNPGAYRMR